MNAVASPSAGAIQSAGEGRSPRAGSNAVHRKWPISIAIQAIGGQGGGVLVDWIVSLAERNGFVAQSTSVAGVAQRTGSTIYYIEMLPLDELPADGRQPVLAQMPIPGEVDIVIASERIEAGRALQRGFITRDRTTVIVSSHRNYSAEEKSAPGNGIADADRVIELVRENSRRLIEHDLQAIAGASGTVISASLFGALAGSGELPFPQVAFEETVRRSGVGVEASLRALRASLELARQSSPAAPKTPSMRTAARPLPVRAAGHALQPLLDRIRRAFPESAWPMLGEGLARVVEFQDVAYGSEYLDRMERVLGWERAAKDRSGHAITEEAALQIAVAMAYDDVIRVADLKTRADRFERIRGELGARADDCISTEEYFHPGLEELCSTLPARLGSWIESSPKARDWVSRRFDRGRRIGSATVFGYLQLRAVAALRRWRRGTLRYRVERAHLEAWLGRVEQTVAEDAALGLELLRCRRLIKGYSDTHTRGTSRFDRLMSAAELLQGRAEAARSLAELREAALRDATGKALEARWKSLGLPTAGDAAIVSARG